MQPVPTPQKSVFSSNRQKINLIQYLELTKLIKYIFEHEVQQEITVNEKSQHES